ncbi:MAG: hypothetical protein J6S06_00930 [Alphaproteobacteria bacterium]|nr:hypothetical protein [Alphaproteobacteria bacterium]
MKIRNIMFTGFMAAILASTAGAATVQVASKGYVDAKVGVNTSSISSLTEKVTANETAIGTKVDQTVYDTHLTTQGAIDDKQTEDIAGLKAKDIELAADIQSNADAIALLTGGEEGEGKLTELTEKINANAAAIEVLNSDAATKDSVAYDIAEALKDYSTTEQVEAKDAQVLTDAKAYADGLAGNYDAKGSAEAALEAAKTYADENDADTIYNDTQVKADIAANAAAITSGDAATLQSAKDYADGLADNYDAAGSAEQALTDAKKYTDDEIDALETSLNGTSTNLTDLTTRVTTAEGEIDTLQGTVGNAESGLVKGVADNAGAITVLETTVGDESAGLVKDVADIKSELTDKITMPDVCDKTTCVLTVNSATKDLEWMPLTEPVEDFLSE